MNSPLSRSSSFDRIASFVCGNYIDGRCWPEELIMLYVAFPFISLLSMCLSFLSMVLISFCIHICISYLRATMVNYVNVKGNPRYFFGPAWNLFKSYLTSIYESKVLKHLYCYIGNFVSWIGYHICLPKVSYGSTGILSLYNLWFLTGYFWTINKPK